MTHQYTLCFLHIPFVFFFSKVDHIYRIMYNTGATFIGSFTKEVHANRKAKAQLSHQQRIELRIVGRVRESIKGT